MDRAWGGRRAILEVVSEFQHVGAFPNAGDSESSNVENNKEFRNFCHAPVKIKGVVGEICGLKK